MPFRMINIELDVLAPPLQSAASSSNATVAVENAVPGYVNKQRVLIFGSRGMTSRYRHLMLDFRAMIPHHKKESKLDSKDMLTVVNEIAALKACDTTIFFEVRKKRDLFLWLSHTPSGPSVKFHVVNVHTMDELRLTGNCLKSSRPILSFDRAFDDAEKAPHLRLIREMLAQSFGVPKGHPKSQPFHDHVLSFGYADGKVWMRHYQVVDKAVDAKEAAKMLEAGEQPTVLVEIGPRCVLQPIRVFGGSMGGPTLWTNPAYISPNALRQEMHLAKAGKYASRVAQTRAREERAEELVLPHNPLDDVFQ